MVLDGSNLISKEEGNNGKTWIYWIEFAKKLTAQGGSDLDHSAMVLALEMLANHKVSG